MVARQSGGRDRFLESNFNKGDDVDNDALNRLKVSRNYQASVEILTVLHSKLIVGQLIQL